MNALEQTIKTDLLAGESWLKEEASAAGLWLWNLTKTSLVALGPTTTAIIQTFFTSFITPAHAGMAVEDVVTSALNTAKGSELAALEAAGTTALKQIVVGLVAAL